MALVLYQGPAAGGPPAPTAATSSSAAATSSKTGDSAELERIQKRI